MDIILEDGLTVYIDHKFIDELQFQVNQMLADDRVDHFIVATSIGIIIEIERIDNTIYVKKQDG